jgi:hypothetical protein
MHSDIVRLLSIHTPRSRTTVYGKTRVVADDERLGCWKLMHLSPRAAPQDLGLGRVQLEAVGVRPCSDVLDAGHEPIVELGGLWWGA